jgi:hypothetical protein
VTGLGGLLWTGQSTTVHEQSRTLGLVYIATTHDSHSSIVPSSVVNSCYQLHYTVVNPSPPVPKCTSPDLSNIPTLAYTEDQNPWTHLSRPS